MISGLVTSLVAYVAGVRDMLRFKGRRRRLAPLNPLAALFKAKRRIVSDATRQKLARLGLVFKRSTVAS